MVVNFNTLPYTQNTENVEKCGHQLITHIMGEMAKTDLMDEGWSHKCTLDNL